MSILTVKQGRTETAALRESPTSAVGIEPDRVRKSTLPLKGPDLPAPRSEPR